MATNPITRIAVTLIGSAREALLIKHLAANKGHATPLSITILSIVTLSITMLSDKSSKWV